MASAAVLDRRKRDRSSADFLDDSSYVKSKRVLHDCMRNMTLNERPSELPPARLEESIETNNDDQSVCESDAGAKLERLNSVETTVSEEESDEERSRPAPQPPEPDNFLAAFKGGRRQYVRKVDYLVDELIRKSQRTAAVRPHHFQEISIPSAVGPHPAVDHALSLLAPSPHFSFHSIAKAEPQALQPEMDAGKDMKADAPPGPCEAHDSTLSARGNPSLYSGDITHGDWEIEELGSTRSIHSPDVSEDSDMAYCDDWSKHPSICNSHSSSMSTMESEDESSHTMEMCSDDKYFSASQTLSDSHGSTSFAVGTRPARGNNSSSPTSVGQRITDDSEDVDNVGTF